MAGQRGPRYRSTQLSVPTPSLQRRDDRIDVIDAATPGAAANALQRGPEARVVRQRRVRRQVGAGRAGGEHSRAFLRPVFRASLSGQVDASLEAVSVNDDPDLVSVSHAPDGAARQRLRSNMTDAGAGGDAGE